MKFLNNRKVKFLIIAQIFIFTVLVSSLISVRAKTNQSNLTQSELEQQMQNVDLVALYDKNATTDITVDGVISPNEYPETFDSFYTGINVSMVYNGTQLFIALTAETTGYIAIGFNHLGFGMVGADIKAGWVNSTGGTVARDYYATAYDFPSIDNKDPSHNDIIEAKGIENNGITTLEMVVDMISRNSTDYTDIVPGVDPSTGIHADLPLYQNQSYSMLLAWAPTDGMTKHYRKGISSVFLAPEGVTKRSDTVLNMVWTGDTNGAKDTYFTATATLKDSLNNPIPNATIGMYLEALIADNLITTATTDSNGIATFNFTYLMEYSSQVVLRTKYMGDINYKKAMSNEQIVDYTGSVALEQAPFLIIPLDMDYLVPWLTGLSAVGTVAFMWVMFGYVIYTVLYKNAVQPDEKQSRGT